MVEKSKNIYILCQPVRLGYPDFARDRQHYWYKMNFVIVFKCCENPYCSRALYFANFATLASWQKQRVTIYFSSNLLVEPVKTPKLRVLQYRIKNKKVFTKTFYICGYVSVRP